ncbi:MAG: TonB-dependent receptor [Bacteroidales bacterium]|nr:TonB-dependent receptor [Bacteroidales bacterium]
MKRFLTFALSLGLLLLVGSGNAASAQSLVEYSGSITEQDSGLTVPAASVFIKGTTTGVTSDDDGHFTIKAEPGSTLVFSCIGYKDVEVVAGSNKTISVVLPTDSFMLEEAIAVGYGTVKKRDLTGSVASVKAADVVKSPGSSIEKMLQGRVAGLTVIDASNDSPESSVTMRVRGMSSINGSNAPLVVIDGVPFGDAGNLSAVNPNIIESIEVLKDASATAIYGSRGANGVILITTKSGQKSHVSVWFSGKVGVGVFSRPLKVWKQDDLVRMAESTNMVYENGGAEGPYMGKVFSDGVYYPSIDELKLGLWPHYTDWTDVVFRTSVTQDYNVGVEGAGEKSRYYASVGYYKGQGVLKGDDYDKISADVSYQNDISKKLSFSSKAGFVHGYRDYCEGSDYGRNPLWPVYNGDGSYYRSKANDYSNPVMANEQITGFSRSINGYIQAKLDWKIIDGLTFSLSGNGKAGQTRSVHFNPPVYTYGGDIYNGEATVAESTWYQVQTDAYLTYIKTIGKNNFSVMLGGSWEDRVDNSSTILGSGFTNTALKYETIDSAETKVIYTGRSEWAIASAFTRINYDWDGKYFATFTARADGSSKFAKGHKWGFFPSGAVSWRMDREPWMKAIGFFDLFKIRASYGISGNQGIGPYQTFEQYGSDYFIDKSTGRILQVHGPGYINGSTGIGNRYVTYGGMANHSLTWEKTSQVNIGLDMAFFHDRLSLTADYYYKFTTDLLRQQYLAPSSGFDTVWVNDGDILNHGFELSIEGRIVDNRDWSLSATGILSLNRNKVVRLGTNENSGFTTDPNGISYTAHGGSVYDSPCLNVLAIGYPVNVFYGYKVYGILQEEFGDGSSRYTEPGELYYKGLKENGDLDPDQRTIIGDPNPKFTGSLSINFTHKIGIDFSMLLYGVYGNDIFSYKKLDNMAYDNHYWTEGNRSEYYPKLRYNRSYWASNWSVEDGSYLRISNITLGYTLPKGNVNFLQNLRVYLSVNNPYTFFRCDEYDPEVGENGNACPAYPKICTITTGLEIKF